jgi:hypothetical protein
VRGQKYGHPQRPGRAYGEAREWIESGDAGLITFDEVCEVFDLDPVRVRRALLEESKRHAIALASATRTRRGRVERFTPTKSGGR